MTKRALYAGTFAPITLGHMDIIESAAQLFDEVIIAVAKTGRDEGLGLTLEKRMDWVSTATKSLSNVKVIALEGSLRACASDNQINWLVRGLRDAQDFSIEHSMANMNYQLTDGVQTIFLTAKPEHQSVSATLVRQLIACKEDISAFVPSAINLS